MLTKTLVLRHASGNKKSFGAALLDVVQDHVLHFPHSEGVFEFGTVLKGGTSLRKFRAGNDGRFSTDLDFFAPDGETANFVLDTLDTMSLNEIRVATKNRKGLKGELEISTPLGRPDVVAKIEFSDRPLWLPTELLAPVEFPIHKEYDIILPELPVPVVEETVAEKLAAWLRRKKARDLYDLYWFGKNIGQFNKPLVRRVFALKVWHDTVNEKLRKGHLEFHGLFDTKYIRDIAGEDIGLLVHKIDYPQWLKLAQERFRFLENPDAIETRLSNCNPRDRGFVQKVVAALPSLEGDFE